MGKNRRPLIALLPALLFCSVALAAPGPTPEGQKLQAFLDSLRVEDLWIAGTHVNWRTGKPDVGPKSGSGTKSHCSAGPLARVLVKKAAKSAENLVALGIALEENISDEAGRRAFRAAIRARAK